MANPRRQITIEGLKLADPYSLNSGFLIEGLEWRIEGGGITAVLGGTAIARSLLLRCLAGLERPAGGKILYREGAEKTGGGRSPEGGLAYLPPPGEEVFTGTTVEEELLFFPPENQKRLDRLASLELYLGTDFRSLSGKSVWELSDSQRRCLLLAAQAMAEPWVWICDEPQGLFDGRRAEGALDFLHSEALNGAVVVAASGEFADLATRVSSVLVLAGRGRPVFQGDLGRLKAAGIYGADWSFRLYEAAAKSGETSSADDIIRKLRATE